MRDTGLRQHPLEEGGDPVGVDADAGVVVVLPQGLPYDAQ
jgi:hypothetical protein